MKIEHQKMLTKKEYSIIMSQITGHIYIDKNACCYIYDNLEEANSFCGSDDKLRATNLTKLVLTQIVTTCYNLGIKAIKAKEFSNESYFIVPIEKKDAVRGYYNPEGNRFINRLKQTGRKEYLRKLKDVRFITPIVITKREEGEYPAIHYGYASTNTQDQYLILFTTTLIFEKWKEKQNENYLPVEISLKEFTEIIGKIALLINPLNDNLFLTREQVLQIFQN